MDKTAFFKLTYGLFIAGTEYEGKLNGCVINTAVQATSEPARMTATMLKTNLTTELAAKKKSMTISVIAADCPMDMIKHFGMNSGRDTDKFEAVQYQTDKNKNPYITEGMLATFFCEISEAKDMGTHILFVLNVFDALVYNNGFPPLTYADYRAMKSGSKAPTETKRHEAKTWVCPVCHYVYDGDIPFEELPESWVCPVCGKPKSIFVAE